MLELGRGLKLPLDAITQTFAILAVRGAGKTNTARVMAEEFHGHDLPFVAIDPVGSWWGLRSSATGNDTGIDIAILGGDHGDLPLETAAGGLVADLIVDERLSCVLDVSEFTESEKTRFLIDFAERLYRRNRDPLHLFLEEADDYAPQKPFRDQARLLGAWQRIVRRGRARGLGITMISQRSAALNKDVLTQIETLIVHRTTSPQDRKAIALWVEYHATKAEILESLATLKDGECWVWSPHWLEAVSRHQVRRARTFDSGATPKQGKARKPARLADVDLAALKDRMADTIERASLADPVQLRRRIAELERDLARSTARAAEEVQVQVPVEVEVEVVPRVVEDWVVHVNGWCGRLDEMKAEGLALLKEMGTALAVNERRMAEPRKPLQFGTAAAAQRPAPARTPQAGQRAAPLPAAAQSVTGNGDVIIGKGEKKVLGVLAQWPDGRTYNELAFLAGYSAKASTLGVILSRLRKVGYIGPSNQPVQLTDDGLKAAGGAQPLPTGPELLDHWLGHSRMGEGERTVLLKLIELYPTVPTHDELCEATGYSPIASTMGVILSRLRKLGLVEKGARRAAPEFMDAIR